jgi:hypothetical protein
MDCQARRRKVRIIHRREGEHPLSSAVPFAQMAYHIQCTKTKWYTNYTVIEKYLSRGMCE